jgi:hypothetical protein
VNKQWWAENKHRFLRSEWKLLLIHNNTNLSNAIESLLNMVDMFAQEQDGLDPSDIHLEEKIR